jgi:hypothetical protein
MAADPYPCTVCGAMEDAIPVNLDDFCVRIVAADAELRRSLLPLHNLIAEKWTRLAALALEKRR